MATINSRDPYDTRDVYSREHNIDVGRPSEPIRGPSQRNWLWPVVLLGALALLAVLFARGMNRRHEVAPPSQMDHPTEPMRSPDQPATPHR